MSKSNKTIVSDYRIYDIIRRPILSEKGMNASQSNQYVFEVDLTATKAEVKVAVEKLFKVSVESVNTLRQKGKVKRFKGISGKRKDSKKAYVAVKGNSPLDFMAGGF